MSGGSNSSTSTTKKEFKPVSSTNPFYSSSTDANGNTVTNFKPGTAGETSYNFVNQNISQLLDSYLNPSLNSVTNQAKLNSFNKQQQQNLQNNIVNPLANNNMIRSSQATNMYNNLSNQAADYSNELIANSQNDTGNMINNLLNLYTTAYQGVSGEQSQSTNTALGGGSSSTKTE